MPSPGDTDNQLWRKILERIDTPTAYSLADTDNNILRKILTRLADDGASGATAQRPQPGDTSYALLRKIVVWLGGTPQPGDTFNGLLRKFLASL